MSDRNETIDGIEKFEQVEVLEEEYIVEKILDKQKLGSVWKYKVKWEGYPEEECTWEPKENLKNVKNLIDKFESRHINNDKSKIDKYHFLKRKTNRPYSNLDSNLNEDQKSISIGSSENKTEKDISSKIQKNLRETLNENEKKELRLNEDKIETELVSEYQDANKQSTNLNKEAIIGNLDIDVPIKIINAKILNDDDVNINCLVKWKPRTDGIIPDRSWISSKELKIKSPMILFEFYESRIRFPRKEENDYK